MCIGCLRLVCKTLILLDLTFESRNRRVNVNVKLEWFLRTFGEEILGMV